MAIHAVDEQEAFDRLRLPRVEPNAEADPWANVLSGSDGIRTLGLPGT
jgi:hypothetical protein